MARPSIIHSIIVISLFPFIFLSSCFYTADYYNLGTVQQQKELHQLLQTIARDDLDSEHKFIHLQQIITLFNGLQHKEKLNLLLTTYVEKHPSDPFDAYYLLRVAQNFKAEGAYPLALHYFERIIKNYNDLLVQGDSVHFICLKNLIDFSKDPNAKIGYYKDIISRFQDKIDLGVTYYFLATTYEELGEWELAMQAYNNFLQFYQNPVPGFPDAEKKVKAMLAFHNSKKDWTLENLDDLIKKIKEAMYNARRFGDSRSLKKYQAKVNFFAMSWEGEATEEESNNLFQITPFISPSIRFAPQIDEISNQKEAYLKTSGWSYRIRTWYLYFARVYSPADPETYGNWQWAGIYFGDKPFTSTGGKK